MYKLGEATEIEVALRRGYAFDVLSDLRDVIHEINHAMTEKRTNLSSQSIATCSQRHISEIRSRILGIRDRYCRCYEILTLLGPMQPKDYKA